MGHTAYVLAGLLKVWLVWLGLYAVYVCLCMLVQGFREKKKIASYHNQAAVKLSLHCNYNTMHFTSCLFSNSMLPPVKPLPTPIVHDSTTARVQ